MYEAVKIGKARGIGTLLAVAVDESRIVGKFKRMCTWDRRKGVAAGWQSNKNRSEKPGGCAGECRCVCNLNDDGTDDGSCMATAESTM